MPELHFPRRSTGTTGSVENRSKHRRKDERCETSPTRGTKKGEEKIEERDKRDRRETCSLYRELSFERTINTDDTQHAFLLYFSYVHGISLSSNDNPRVPSHRSN